MRSGLSSGNVAGHRKPHHSLSGLSDGRLQERSSRNGAAVRGKLLYGRNVGFLRLLPFLQFLPCLFRPTIPAHFLLRSLNVGSLHSVRSKAEGTYQQRKYYFYSDSHLFNYKFLTRKTEQYPFIFTRMPEATGTALRLIQHFHFLPKSLFVTRYHHLCNPLPIFDDEGFCRKVDENNTNFTTVIGINRSRSSAR